MIDDLLIISKIKLLTISDVCFENNRKCLHLKKLNTCKLKSDFRFA
jgi:hypothetical protein